ncbi:MAG: hypothetical protein ACRDIY_14325, partial [Chloroflexota bacterium]
MRDESAGRGQSDAGTELAVTPLQPSETLARRFGEEILDGDEFHALSHAGRPLATLRWNRREATLRAIPTAELDGGLAADRVEYAAAVLEFAARRVAERGRLLDVSDPLPERLLDPIADQLPAAPTRENPIVGGPFSLGSLSGEIRHLGAADAYKPDRYQVALRWPEGDRPILLSFPGAESPVHRRAVRVSPHQTVLVVGLDETTTELAGYLRGLGLDVAVAEQSTVARRDRIDELTERGFLVRDAADSASLIDALAGRAPVRLIVEGYCSDTILDADHGLETEAKAREAANRATVIAIRQRFGCPVLYKDQAPESRLFDAPARRLLTGAGLGGTEPTATGYRFLSPNDSALLSAILPVLAPETDPIAGLGAADGSVEISVDLLLPTAAPYGARNRHSPDDVAVKVARGAERRLLAALDDLDPRLKERLRPIEDPEVRRQRPRALAVHQRFGPWNVHAALDVEIRATRPDGSPIGAADYRELLTRAGDVRLVDFDDLGLEQEQILALDGVQLQNVAFQKLGKIHHFRATGVALPLSDRAFKVILLVPQGSGGYLNHLEAALALTDLAGDDAPMLKRLAEEAVDLPRIDDRLADTFPARGRS